MREIGAPKVTVEEWEKALVKRAAIELFTCRECGSTAESPVVDCCDYCILKFHFEDADSPSLHTFRQEEVIRYLTGEGIHGRK